jgi:hypothetical protein
MRPALLLAVLCLAVLAGSARHALVPGADAVGPGLTVTSTSDVGAAGGAVCPHAAQCTLRRAIEIANADASGLRFTIDFDPVVFPAGAPATISVGTVPLPNIARADVTITSAGAGVSLQSASTSLTLVSNGLTITAPGFVLRGMSIRGFTGSCVAVTGDDAVIGEADAGNLLGGCKSGIAVSGSNARIQGNSIGFGANLGPDPINTGVVIAGSGALLGGPASSPATSNRIGFADTAVFVGSGAAAAFSGVVIERNVLGTRANGDPAPVGTGIILSQPSNGALVTANAIANVETAIEIRPDAGGVSVIHNRLVGNTFSTVTGMAIDLAADGLMNPNDPDDSDAGPNLLLNHPVIVRATQTRITGISCPGCQVQVYRAFHTPGGSKDYGIEPLSQTSAVADAAGQFAIDNAPTTPGEWLLALATDADGNTSEFGPSARVGAGAVLCGNVQLQAGWNHVGYFGAQPVALLATFPADPSGSVTAIYRVIDGTTDFERWFSTTALGRTLQTVEPGESYWFFATAPVTLPGGFSLSFPLPVHLKAGWNDLVYLGASADVADALGSLNGNFSDLYHYDGAAGWLRFGGLGIPSWAQNFSTLQACGVYQVRLESPATLVPLQP